MNGSGTSGGGGSVPSSVGGLTAPARWKLARRSATDATPVAAVREGVDDLVAIEEEDVVGGVDHTLGDEPVAHRQDEATEHADVQLVDVEGVVLGEREAVPRRLVELVELGQRLGIVGELLAQLGQQLLAGGDVVLVLDLGVLALVEVDHRPDAGQRDRRILAPRHVGEVVHGVAAPAELEQELVELTAEVPALVALVEGAEQLDSPPCCRTAAVSVGLATTVRLSAHRPRAASTERVWKPCSVRYASVGSSGCITLS